MFVKNDGRQFYFCGRKCEMSMLRHGREARKYKWTAAYQKGGIKAQGNARAAKPAPKAPPAVPQAPAAPAVHAAPKPAPAKK